MLRLVVLVCLVSLALSDNPPQGGSLDDLIGSVFPGPGKPAPTPDHTGSQPGHVGPLPGKPGVLPPPGVQGGNNPGPQPIPGFNPCGFGECVPYYQCSNGSIITDGEGLLDIRFGEENGQTDQHPCTGLLQTCCTLRSNEPNIPPVQIVEGCGYRNVDGVGFRITGDKDNEAQFGEFPWTVAILKEEQASGQVLNVYQCGGSLIHPSVVLTAAHCISGKDPKSLKIRAGEWDTQTKDEIFPHQDQTVSDYVVHEQYYKGGLFNDVALLFLSEPVALAENVNTVCLPPQNHVFDYSRCFASGWGKDLFGAQGKYQVILKRVELPVVPHESCEQSLRKTRLGTHFELHNSFICAGGERGKDTCKGDGGSPLVCPIPGTVNRYYQAGIVAWGIGCGDDHTPGVYVNIPLFREWIDDKLQHKRLPTTNYNYA